jgi:hypothetical protein
VVGLFQRDVALEYGIVFWLVKAASQGATDDTVNFTVYVEYVRYHNIVQVGSPSSAEGSKSKPKPSFHLLGTRAPLSSRFVLILDGGETSNQINTCKRTFPSNSFRRSEL